MRPFTYERAQDLAQAARAGRGTGQGQTDAPVQYLAGGATLVDLMKLDVLRPQRVVDITPLQQDHAAIEAGPAGLRMGALAKMSAAADHPAVQRDYPVIAQSLQLAASAQLRNMATLGGNLLQRTRCPYYRDPSWSACNKRAPGSGCSAIGGVNRTHAVLGVDDSCIAQYPGDFAVALAALGAELELMGPGGARTLPLEALHRPPGGTPQVETTLASGELITAIRTPAGPWTRRSLYLKVRDRASYEFALASAAVALDLDGDVVRQARIGLGGMAYRPWRAREAETLLAGKPLTEAAAEAAARAAFAGAVTHGGNDFKPELGRRTLVRALLQAAKLEA
ncbi:xanthine dehydrogenase family protein subunit M [Phenylobacterium sp.]|jgi:xanthine dehydrogenase YagS FAD-binding subunit|uniref:FAD binding domain-containing protein n=1 Tax=Phenylobacterium sp. TaxID=1871053 RepID=UPI002F3F2F6D